ncbi:MAG: hypothetical protein EOS54_15720 [Mesorhizobium sp.]|nr:hypothetical protein EN742_12720 [Mesorhizobium sp. M4A.F.Ca.ET.020.02.1.1]RWC09472.1 MAG: hypothetical protein EOS53_30505 [Mesorhizobium sp.]RWC25565.1 MAG: hypothetical protein EOS70_33420 [Mesorhizobium sp.]RWC52382.1 MAG: hypothetical protein EOS54_15720 [Mesorhizobium sp.]RWD40513.1 MAG: hypothetical protein EOS35_31330 [Mesorhizobium sp.]
MLTVELFLRARLNFSFAAESSHLASQNNGCRRFAEALVNIRGYFMTKRVSRAFFWMFIRSSENTEASTTSAFPVRTGWDNPYPIGHFHIDIAEVQVAEGKLRLFVAIDRRVQARLFRLDPVQDRHTRIDLGDGLCQFAPGFRCLNSRGPPNRMVTRKAAPARPALA